MEYKFEGKELIIKTSDLFEGNRQVTVGADTNYHATGYYIFPYDGTKDVNNGDIFNDEKDIYKEDCNNVGLKYNDKDVTFTSEDGIKPTLLVDTYACVKLGDREYTNKLLFRKYNKDEADKIQTGIYYVTLNGEKIDGMTIRVGTNVPCIMKEQGDAQYKPVFLIYVPDTPTNAPAASTPSTVTFYFTVQPYTTHTDKTIWISNSAGSAITDQEHNNMFNGAYLPHGTSSPYSFTFKLENEKYKLTNSTLPIIYSVSGSSYTLLQNADTSDRLLDNIFKVLVNYQMVDCSNDTCYNEGHTFTDMRDVTAEDVINGKYDSNNPYKCK